MARSVEDADRSGELRAAVIEALQDQRPHVIVGGGSKSFLGVVGDEPRLNVAGHCGIVSYEPTELVVTVRAGTPLQDLTAVLDDAGQMLPFEPPLLPGATIGGTIACGLSGPRRISAGSARDFVLGTRVINGQGQDLHFGGEVMKNVAGYDVSRLQAGAFGTLGVLLDISMKVMPRPEVETTLCHSLAQRDDLSGLHRLARRPWPLSAAMVIGNRQYTRFSGSEAGVRAAVDTLGGETLAAADAPWQSLRDLHHAFFVADDRPLWRIGIAAHAPVEPLCGTLTGDWLFDWGGAQRWLKCDLPAPTVFDAVADAGGHATRFSATDDPFAVFQPLDPVLGRLQRRIRDSFDPRRLFNPGRFHPEIDRVPTREDTAPYPVHRASSRST